MNGTVIDKLYFSAWKMDIIYGWLDIDHISVGV